MKVAIASDHAGFSLKERLIEVLKDLGEEVLDLGPANAGQVDYPDFAVRVAEKVSRGEVERGVLICGTGIGMSITANRYAGVRAALVNDLYTARLSREHNDANVLVLGGRVIGPGLAEEILRVWLRTEFAGGRHADRLAKLSRIENEISKER